MYKTQQRSVQKLSAQYNSTKIVTVIAVTQLKIVDILITCNKLQQYSSVLSRESPFIINADTAINAQPNIDPTNSSQF